MSTIQLDDRRQPSPTSFAQEAYPSKVLVPEQLIEEMVHACSPVPIEGAVHFVQSPSHVASRQRAPSPLK